MSATVVRPRRGIVLFAALALLALLGLLLAGAIASMTLASRSEKLAESSAILDAAAEFAANSVLADPESFAPATLPLGQARSFERPVPGSSDVRAAVTVTRLRDGILWIVGESWTTGAPPGSRRVNVVARLPLAAPVPIAPLVARGPIAFDSSVVFAADSASEADCAPSATAPRTAASSDSAAYLLTLAQRALLDSAPNVIHARHDTTIGPGSFSGIVVADGSLTIVGPYAVVGLVVARGAIVARGGLSLTGSLLSFDSTTHAAITVNAASVRYSPCAVARELRRLLPPRRVRSRAWLEVY